IPNSLQSSDIGSPASRRATNCSLSSMTEHSFQGIASSPKRRKSVTYVFGTICYLCLGSVSLQASTDVLRLRPAKSDQWASLHRTHCRFDATNWSAHLA